MPRTVASCFRYSIELSLGLHSQGAGGHVRTGDWEWTILADQVLEVRYRKGRLHLIRRSRLAEAEDEPPHWGAEYGDPEP